MGVLLGIMREYGRSLLGERLYAQKPFYRGERMTVIGAITQDRVIAFDIIGKSMKGEDFKQFIQEHLVPQLWEGAVVVMDKLSAHKVAGIKEMIEAVGAKVEYLSGYSPDFNPIEHLWWELKAFIRRFVPKSKEVVEKLLRLAIHYLISSVHLRNYFIHCCYCPS
jgi:putative transposase